MAEITVFFRVVGVYFGSVPGDPPNKNVTEDIPLTVPENPTVKRVTQEAHLEAQRGNISGVNSFHFSTTTVSGNTQLLDQVHVGYSKPPKNNRNYPPGLYSLKQNLNSNPQRVFQYYHYDVRPKGEGQPPDLLRKNTNNDFVPFDQKPTDEIVDGDYICWRLVSIDTQPFYIPDFDVDPEELYRYNQVNNPLQTSAIQGATEAQMADLDPEVLEAARREGEDE
jgi:hypothetical protein